MPPAGKWQMRAIETSALGQHLQHVLRASLGCVTFGQSGIAKFWGLAYGLACGGRHNDFDTSRHRPRHSLAHCLLQLALQGTLLCRTTLGNRSARECQAADEQHACSNGYKAVSGLDVLQRSKPYL